MLPINSNTIDLSKYRGTITRCPHCSFAAKPNADSIVAERITLGKACATCLGHGFVARCINCDGTGLFKGSAMAFGGGDVPHTSACNYCGASGYFAVRQPANWVDEEVLAPVAAAV